MRLDHVRCPRCYSLQAPGSFQCRRCSVALELEPLLDATDAPCPRCARPLEASARPVAGVEGALLHECPRCGGIFVPREVLAEVLACAERSGPFAAEVARAPLGALEEVRYVPCPLCRTTMNRANFGKVSGVIVDVCKKHGTWFDGGELTRIVAFAANGGLLKTRAREAQDAEQRARDRAEAERETAMFRAQEQTETNLSKWRHLLDVLLFW